MSVLLCRKKKFEKALEKFPHAEKLEITWHSFQLDPQLVTQPDVNPYEYFAKSERNYHRKSKSHA